MQIDGLSHLGSKTDYKQDYAPEMLEAFENKHRENDYWVIFDCPEFTSLCPITGQPDFATIRINYLPDIKMVESKSLKLYLFSFRNHGAFHEDCINIIMNIPSVITSLQGVSKFLIVKSSNFNRDSSTIMDEVLTCIYANILTAYSSAAA